MANCQVKFGILLNAQTHAEIWAELQVKQDNNVLMVLGDTLPSEDTSASDATATVEEEQCEYKKVLVDMLHTLHECGALQPRNTVNIAALIKPPKKDTLDQVPNEEIFCAVMELRNTINHIDTNSSDNKRGEVILLWPSWVEALNAAETLC
ncbi:unnamed protein product [Mycena citricolor]|uniref:Uncharacterized protein n=1 Tax=Mycena citricolor TaxID=2018698 RepID=A0AAD2GZ09_9AGAR|nr:unnamed protein product [Mycena citricolor]